MRIRLLKRSSPEHSAQNHYYLKQKALPIDAALLKVRSRAFLEWTSALRNLFQNKAKV